MNNMAFAPYVAPFASFITVTLFILSLFPPKRNTARDKLQAYVRPGAHDADKLSRPFSERVAFPILERLGRLLTFAAPQRVKERTNRTLEQAGNPVSFDTIFALQAIGVLGLPIGFLALTLPAQHRLEPKQLLVTLLLAYVGGFLPQEWLKLTARKRQRLIRRALPDALDLIVVSMEAGLGLDGAIAKVVEKTKGPLKDELGLMLREIQLGKPRRDAFREVAKRTGVEEMIALMNSVVQADQMGVSMSQVMRTQADEARLKRRQHAEEQAHKAAVKMLFPLVLFIMPSMMIVTVGPAALLIYHEFVGGALGGGVMR